LYSSSGNGELSPADMKEDIRCRDTELYKFKYYSRTATTDMIPVRNHGIIPGTALACVHLRGRV
jgi:hypothetical protein